MSEIKNLNPSSAVLSQHDYTYNAVGTIATWQQQTDSNPALLWTEGYDAADQLTSAVQTSTAITSPALVSDSYGYDAAGNLNSASGSGISRSPSSNALNQLTGSTPSGTPTVQLTGLLNGADTVTVNGTAATVNGSHYFSGSATVTSGTINTVSVVATDSNGNSRTNHYQVTTPAQLTYSPTYDADGNELTNGAGQSYAWDAKNELATITYTGGATSNFTYDALGRRIGIIEKNSGGTVTSTKQFVWDGAMIAEERNVSNTVTKRFYPQGEQISGTSYYYTRDHLGSVREMTDSSGTIQARYDYDPYGRTTLVSGTNLSDFQYAGMYMHQTSGLNLTLFRAYDPNTGRWIGRDPIGEDGGINLYGYCLNSPIGSIDPLGLDNLNLVPTTGPAADPVSAQIVNAAGTNSGSFSVGAHGDPYGIEAADGIHGVTAQQLADMIKNHKGPDGKNDYNPANPVVLNACNTGSSIPGGKPNFAQQLANALNNTVIAPTGPIQRSVTTYPLLGTFTQTMVGGAGPFGTNLPAALGGYAAFSPSQH